MQIGFYELQLPIDLMLKTCKTNYIEGKSFNEINTLYSTAIAGVGGQ